MEEITQSKHHSRIHRRRAYGTIGMVALGYANHATDTARRAEAIMRGKGRFSDWATAAILAFVVVTVALWFAPASLWLDMRSIRISDSKPGIAPAMFVDRSINLSFGGNRTVVVMRKNLNGFSYFCSTQGYFDFVAGSPVPTDINLSQWMTRDDCVLPAGQYIVQFSWDIRVLGALDKYVRVTSNVFTIAD